MPSKRPTQSKARGSQNKERKEPRTEEERNALRKRALEQRQNLTPAETVLWQRLDEGKLLGHKFHCQHLIGYYIVDFYCVEAGLVIEIADNNRQGQGSYERRRDAYLESRGLKIIHLSNSDIMNRLDAVLENISQKLRGV